MSLQQAEDTFDLRLLYYYHYWVGIRTFDDLNYVSQFSTWLTGRHISWRMSVRIYVRCQTAACCLHVPGKTSKLNLQFMSCAKLKGHLIYIGLRTTALAKIMFMYPVMVPKHLYVYLLNALIHIVGKVWHMLDTGISQRDMYIGSFSNNFGLPSWKRVGYHNLVCNGMKRPRTVL